MQRYQLYLKPTTVAIFEEGERLSGISRSALFRQALERAADQMVTFFSKAVYRQSNPKETYALDNLIGIIKIKGAKKTDFARHVDDDLYNDPRD